MNIRAENVSPINTDFHLKRVYLEAKEVMSREPALTTFIFSSILSYNTLEDIVFARIAHLLDHADVPANLIRQAAHEAIKADSSISIAMRMDIQAVMERDPASSRMIEPILYYKGFHAIQTHRLAHWLYTLGRKDFAYYLQSRSSSVFQCDIHPQASFGHGIFLDHATGLVVGQTAKVGNHVSILHEVTLGGTGKEHEDRHPKIGNGVMLGAGAKILGNITIGNCSRVAAGSVVLQNVPANKTVAGVPAKEVGEAGCEEPSRAMNQNFSDCGCGQ